MDDSEDMYMESGGDGEIDLLHQFQCMGTSDREQLVDEFCRVLGPAMLRPEAAVFFLEMNNWNLQQAVGAYFDLDSSREILGHNSVPSMTLIKDTTTEDGGEITPSTSFVKSWKFHNPGPDSWPTGCCLKFLEGDQMTTVDRVMIEPINPGQVHQVNVTMLSPSQPGTYLAKWRMSTSEGLYFGEIIWVFITVAEGRIVDLTQQMSSFQPLKEGDASNQNQNAGFMGPPPNPTSWPLFQGSPGPSMFHPPPPPPPPPSSSSSSCSPNQGHSNHVPTFDRLKSIHNDDNRENCIQVCNSFLNRSQSFSGSTSSLVSEELTQRTSTSSSTGSPPTTRGEGDQRQPLPPTPPLTEDMML